MAINYLIEEALTKPNSRFWYIAPTYSQAKMIAWRMLVDQLRELPPELVKKKNESELYVSLGNNSLIEFKGADNEDNLRGAGLDGVVLDEYASMKPHVYEEIIRPMLLDTGGWGFFIGTPKGYNHFYELYNKGCSDKHKDYESFHFTSYDNPFNSKEDLEKIRDETGDELFAQEYMAEFKQFQGLIYKEFDRKYHTLPGDWRPQVGSLVYRAMDFGAHNPTVCLWIHVNNDGEVIVFDEYYATGQTTQGNAGQVLARWPEYAYTVTFGDPSGKQEILDYASFGLHISPAVKIYTNETDWVNSGINEVKSLLKINPTNGRPKLFITENCVNLLKEFESYQWTDKPKSPNVEWRDVPVKKDDHGPDALRYFVVSYRPVSQAKRRGGERKQPQRIRSSVTGY